MQKNDRFIISAILAGLINRVVWIQPGWTHPQNQYVDQEGIVGTVTHGKGREADQGKLCYCYREVEKRDWFCGYFTSHPEKIEIPRKGCRKLKTFKFLTISEFLFQDAFDAESLKEKKIILDIDEDYFGVESGVQLLVDAEIPLDVVYVIDELLPQLFCPKSTITERDLDHTLCEMFLCFHDLLIGNTTSLATSYSRTVNNHVEKYLCMNSNTNLLTFSSYLESKLTAQIAFALANTKYCFFNSLQLELSSDFTLCHGTIFPGDKLNELFVDTRDGIEKRSKDMTGILGFIFNSVTPNLITIARSLRDGFVPRRQQRFIEHNIRKAIDENLKKRGKRSRVLFDKNLVSGKEGWTKNALEF